MGGRRGRAVCYFSLTHECLRFYERFIGFHSPLRRNPLNVSTIIRLITLSALGHSRDLTKIRNWKLLSQYKAINLCHPAVKTAQGNNVVPWPTWSRGAILFRMSAFIGRGFVTPRLLPRTPRFFILTCSDTLQIAVVCIWLGLLWLFSGYSWGEPFRRGHFGLFQLKEGGEGAGIGTGCREREREIYTGVLSIWLRRKRLWVQFPPMGIPEQPP